MTLMAEWNIFWAGLYLTLVGDKPGWFPHGVRVEPREFASRGGRGNLPFPHHDERLDRSNIPDSNKPLQDQVAHKSNPQ